MGAVNTLVCFLKKMTVLAQEHPYESGENVSMGLHVVVCVHR